MHQQQSEQQIRELLARYVKGECTEAEIALLERWYDRISNEKDSIQMLSREDEDRLVEKLWRSVDREKYNHRRILRIAAVWVGIFVVSGAVLVQWNRRLKKNSQNSESEFTSISTGYQQVRKVLLPDSSIVWLNSATHLWYHPNFATNRIVKLSGEAFFQVAPDVEHPFVVMAGKTSTRVFGTAFNISAYPQAGQVRVSLQYGKVGVECIGKGEKEEKVLTPGQLLIYDKVLGSEKVMHQAPGEMDVWTAGRLLFYETPISEALAQVEARYGVHIVFDRPLKEQTITAKFDNTALDKVLEHLSFGWDLHFTRAGDTLHVRQGRRR